MPRGRPKARLFMTLGKIEVHRPDNLNWSVETGENTFYYPTLHGAIKEAAKSAAESKAKSAFEWLAEYDKIERRLEATIKKAIGNWTLDGPGED